MDQVQAIFQQLPALWAKALQIWQDGGWAMYAIAFNALVMFAMAMHIYLGLRDTGFASVPERTWRRWIHHPGERRGPIGALLDFVAGARTLKESAVNFDEIQASEIAPFQRDLMVLRIAVAAAPLLGLLGTVTGMLATFDALAKGSGGDQTMDQVAKGISEALITTMTGLVIAIPGMFLQHMLARKCDRYKNFLAHVETVFNQSLYWDMKHKKLQRAVQ